MARELPKEHVEYFQALIGAAAEGQLALLDCENPEGESRSVICIAVENKDKSVTFIPLAEMCEENPITYYTPPRSNNDNPGTMEENVSE